METLSVDPTATHTDSAKIDALVKDFGLDRENIEPMRGEDCLDGIFQQFVSVEVQEQAERRVMERYEPKELASMSEAETEQVIGEAVDEVMAAASETDGDGVGNPRTNDSDDGLSGVPSGEWGDYDGVTDEWGTQREGSYDASLEGQSPRLNTGTPAAKVFERLSPDEWLSLHDIVNSDDRMGVREYESELADLVRKGHAEQNEAGEYRVANPADSGERTNERPNNMAGVPGQVTRDASSLGGSDPDLSGVPSGEWDKSLPNAHESVVRSNDSDGGSSGRTNDDVDTSGVPSGEWPTPTERLNSASVSAGARKVKGRLDSEEWTRRSDLDLSMSKSPAMIDKAIHELKRLGLIERDQYSAKEFYRLAE